MKTILRSVILKKKESPVLLQAFLIFQAKFLNMFYETASKQDKLPIYHSSEIEKKEINICLTIDICRK